LRIIDPSVDILYVNHEPLKLIEIAARTCYASLDRITETSAPGFIKTRVLHDDPDDVKHISTIEHSMLTVRFIIDRGASHELVRHRHTSFSQESTRYVSFGKKDGEITVIRPTWWKNDGSKKEQIWLASNEQAERAYMGMLAEKAPPEDARDVLPTCLKTTVITTANFSQWRHIFVRRTSKRAHKTIRWVMRALLAEMRERVPVIFDDVGEL